MFSHASDYCLLPGDLTRVLPSVCQVNAAVPPPQYTTVTQNQNAQNNGTLYLTTDYVTTYRDYYPTASTVQTVTSDQYQTVRQQLSSSPAVTYTQAGSDQQQQQQQSDSQGSFLDRYLRQPPVTSTTNGAAFKQGTLQHGGLTVDLPSPDSGIGEATVTPRPENGSALTQVCVTVWPFITSLDLVPGNTFPACPLFSVSSFTRPDDAAAKLDS